MLPFDASSQAAMAALDPSYYPPARTGLRGSHPGSYDAAHARAWAGRSHWGPTTDLSETYDCVVVGGGLSGLAAGYFYQQEHGRDKKVLILDNHDDFGGHAKRNEHTVDGRIIIGQGGSESLESPQGFGETVSDLMAELGVDTERLEETYDVGFYKREGLGAGRFRHCILFRVQQDVATVWGACGWMDQTRLLVQFSSSAVSGNPLELLQAHDDYRGDTPIEQAYVPFFQQLGLNYPAQISLRPVRVAGRRVGILYGDEGQDRPLRGTEAGDRELTGRLSLGLTLCLIKNKLRSP